MRQHLAPWIFHRKGSSGQTEDPADQIWAVGCMLNHADEEFSRVICVSPTTSTDDCAVSLANAKSSRKSPSIPARKDPYSIFSLCANLLAIGHSLLIAGLRNPIHVISDTGQRYKGNCHHPRSKHSLWLLEA